MERLRRDAFSFIGEIRADATSGSAICKVIDFGVGIITTRLVVV